MKLPETATKRWLVALGAFALILVVLVFLLFGSILTWVGGAWTHPPEQLLTALSPDAKALVEKAYKGLDVERLVDHHTHIVGLGTGRTGVWANPRMRSPSHPIHWVRFQVYAGASGITNLARADAEYVERLTDLIRYMPHPGRHQILAFDYFHDKEGRRVEENSEFYVPNKYIFELSAKYPDFFLPVMSVHPYRRDALPQLTAWAARGGRLIKWLPNAMNIDASDPALDGYYAKVKELGLTILTHVGEEKAVEAEEGQKLGNPLLFRRPLDQGVRIIMAHCGSLGENEDLDSPNRERRTNFELFMRLMDEKKYEGLLFGEVSAMTQFNRVGLPLQTILERQDLHSRFINGSDYPLPSINIIIRTSVLEDHGFITTKERKALNEIYDVNPLLFDFVVKRTIRSPNNGAQLSENVFYSRPLFSGPPVRWAPPDAGSHPPPQE